MDLSGEEGCYLISTPGSRTKFQIVTPDIRLKFKASKASERDKWLAALSQEMCVEISDDV